MDKINELLVRLTLEKGRGNKSVVAAALGEKPQTFGNYLKGRSIPITLIRKWKKVYGEDLLLLSETDVETNVDKSNNDKSFKREPDEPTPKQWFDKAVEQEITKRELIDRLYKDLDNQARHLDKALDLLAKHLPIGQSVERVTPKNR